jgi:DNA-binding response OmpR family regulator
LNTILLNFESLAQRNNVNIRFTNEKSLPVFSFIDVEKFERIFYNLLSNSLKFTESGGSVTIVLNSSNNSTSGYKITVSDTGRGISENHIPFIFNRFYRVYNPEFPVSQGAGIGLALVKEYTVLHGGTINVKSKPGIGTSFILDFPVVESKMDFEKHLHTDYSKPEFADNKNPDTHVWGDEIEYYIKSAEKENERNSIRTNYKVLEEKDKTIVIIEDNSDMRSYINDILKNDYKVLDASNGTEGFDIITANMPDLIISDVMMPGMDGMELCKKLKTDIRTEHIPVILLTARSLNEDSIEGYLTGADDYISKPFGRELLLIRINNLIESRKKIREHFKTKFLMEPEHTLVESKIEQFINKTVKTVECHISDSNFNVEQLALELGISQAQLYRKLTSVVGQSPAEFMRVIRLKRAAKILEESIEKDINISEIGFSLGFSNISHFSKLFKKHYGISPTEYARKFQ